MPPMRDRMLKARRAGVRIAAHQVRHRATHAGAGTAGVARAVFRLGSGVVSHRIGAQFIVRDKPRLDDVFCRLSSALLRRATCAQHKARAPLSEWLAAPSGAGALQPD
jgi:hypothetical protein